jgi:chromosome segregation protein
LSAEAELDGSQQASQDADLSEAVTVAEGLRARAAGLVALLEERARGIDRDRTAAFDKDVVATLEAEAAALESQLAEAQREAEALLPLEAQLVEAEAALEQPDVLDPGTEAERPGGAPLGPSGREGSGDPAAVAAEIAALHRSVELASAELARLGARKEAVEHRLARLQDEVARLEAVLAESQAALPVREAAAEEARKALAAADERLAAAGQERRAAEAERHHWSARAEALSQALDEARARAGARHLANVEGALGALLELVEVDDGWQAAFEAAAGEALAAVVVDGYEAARRGLAHLASHDMTGAVIALSGGAATSSSTAATTSALGGTPSGEAGYLAGAGSAGSTVRAGCTWLREHVRSRAPGVEGLLDRLLAGAVAVEGDWEMAGDVAVDNPELVVVTLAGDRCAKGIWRIGARGTGATGAALQQARAALAEAEVAAERSALAETEAREAAEHARSAVALALSAVQAIAARLKATGEALSRARSDLAETRDEAAPLALQQAELSARCAAEQDRAKYLEAVLPRLQAARQRLAERTAAVGALRRELELRAASIEERRGLLGHRRAQVEQRLARIANERADAQAKRARLEVLAAGTGALTSYVRSRLVGVEQALSALREARRSEVASLRAASEQLEALRRERAAVEHRLLEVRERSSRAELEETELKSRLELLSENVRRELDCEPASLQDAECPALAEGTSPSSRVRELERELRLMGPVNPLALEEYAALQERHAFLEEQLHDVQAARRELSKVIKAVDAEIVTVFKAAFDDVRENFANLFATLFPGGQASVYLTDPSNLLEAGVDIEVRPVGKNVRRLSLLSGGERSLVALAFLFAVFRSRPSPFYMMDEVESALDDVNLHRFLDLVNEFRSEAQLLIVSHQKRTMEAADCLYGVTMAPGGSSKVVSQVIERTARAAPVGQA